MDFNLNLTDFYYFNETTEEPPSRGENENTISSTSVWTPEVISRVVTVMVVMISTLVGNVFLILMLVCKPSRRIKRVNVFIINLAIGDLAVAGITMTTEILFVAFGEWVLGPVLCKLCVYLQVVTLASATFLLTGMSIDRYQVIVKPMESLARRPKIWTKVLGAWILSFIFALPQLAIFVEVTQESRLNGTQETQCVSYGYTAQWQRKVYFSFHIMYILIVPSAIMLYCYYNIAKVVWARHGRSGNSIQNGGSRVDSPRMSVRRNLVSASKQRVVTMTLTVIIGFLVCLLPYFVISLIRIYSDYRIKLKDALVIAEIIFMIHSAVNPILYGIFTLRVDHLKAVFFCFRRNHRLREDIERTRIINESKCYKIRYRLALLRKNPTYKEATVIIANHSAKDERELLARNGRKPKSIKSALRRRNLQDGGLKHTKMEKGVQVSDTVYLNPQVVNGVIEFTEGGTSV